jgi:microsomal dipeptidase-like Zn-dependent dipeptidase
MRVINKLLDISCGRRILIDIKHIDYRGRKEYYHFIKEKYKNQVPVVFSHAAVGEETEEKIFNPWTINLNIDDIQAVWETKGLIGLELDQRILGFDEYLRYCKKHEIEIKRKSPEFNAALVWNAARFIANECAGIMHSSQDEKRTNAWGCISIGSDFDGLINPINGYPTLRYFDELEKQLIKLAKDFLNEPPRLLHRYSPASAEELVEGIMTTHGLQFLKTNYQNQNIPNSTSYLTPKPILS